MLELGYVARKIPTTSRRREVSWSNHQEVAALPPAEREELLAGSQDPGNLPT